MTKKVPWEYQLAASTALWNQLHTDSSQNPLVVMPTGTGKSLTMAIFIWGFLTTYPRARILNLTHVKELVGGNYRELIGMWPAAPAGIYSAGLKRRDFAAQVLFGGIKSFANIVDRFGKVDLLIIDEAHRVSDEQSSTYGKVIKQLREKNPALVVIGFTATDYRMKMGKLTEGELFDVVCFDLSSGPAFVWMIDQRYLIKLVPKRPATQVDESQVLIRAGEYDEASASEAFHDLLEAMVDETIKTGQDRKAWLTFCQSINDAELVADMFRYKGYAVEPVHSKRADRDEVLAAFAAGKLRGVTNNNVLTTGYDHPGIDLIAMMRLTRTPGLWVQMLGRGTRPCWTPGFDLSTWEGRNESILASHKQSCLVLDFAGNTERLGPINYPTMPKRRGSGGGSPPVRECPECGTYNHISLKACEECGYVFPVEEKRTHKPSTAELVVDLSTLPPPVPKEYGTFPVSQMIAAKHTKKGGGTPTVRVDYFCGVRRFTTWVCPEHFGFARAKATQWWTQHGGTGLGPSTVDDLLAAFSTLKAPYYIKVWLNTKYPEIEAYDFTGAAFELPPELGGPPRRALPQAVEERSSGLTELLEMNDDEIPF